MPNARAELKEVLAADNMAGILAAEVSFNEEYNYLETDANGRPVTGTENVPGDEIMTLPMNFTSEEEAAFWAFLDTDYDAGFGGQELFGTIWLSDGSWLERHEYDGQEWWTLKKRPPIPRR